MPRTIAAMMVIVTAGTRERDDALEATIDAALRSFLAARRDEMAAIHPDAALLVDEIVRLVDAGGRRMRPALVYWGHLAAGGGDGDELVVAAASFELLHTMALIHDDVLDDAVLRRGVPTVHRHVAAALAPRPDAEAAGRAVAIVCGDLAAVLADRMLLTSGFPASRVAEALLVSYGARAEMAAGQRVGVGDDVERTASLKGGAYSVEAPLVLGATLAGASERVLADLRAFGRPLGVAFQLADDLRDGDASPGVDAGSVDGYRRLALEALDAASLRTGPAAALRRIAIEVVP